MFDIAGHRTGNGNPVWLETHAPAARTASAVERLLAAGASMVGKTHTDEMAYSLNGENVHYGTPTNPHAPGRIPGGSSSGSAVAVAGGLVDFALGTDCGGSVRLPASYCGIYGIRTTHGLGAGRRRRRSRRKLRYGRMVRARRRRRCSRVGDVLLPAASRLRAEALADRRGRIRFRRAKRSQRRLPPPSSVSRPRSPDHRQVRVYTGDPAAWSGIFRILQGDEIRRRHGAWIDAHNPSFGPGIAERFRWTRTIDPAEVERMRPQREDVARHMDSLLGDDARAVPADGAGHRAEACDARRRA